MSAWHLIVALLLAFLVLLVMLVTLYLTGAIIPLSLVWLVHPRQRSKGLKVLMVWVGVACSHVLLFLLLGIAFRIVGGLATSFDKPALPILANPGRRGDRAADGHPVPGRVRHPGYTRKMEGEPLRVQPSRKRRPAGEAQPS